MPRVSKRIATLAVLAITAGGLAACSSTSSNTASSTAPTAAPAARNHSPAGRWTSSPPAARTTSTRCRRLRGGLRNGAALRQAAGLLPDQVRHDHRERGVDERRPPAADAATKVPTTANSGVTDGGEGVHLPRQAGRQLGRRAGPPGRCGGLHARVQGVLQPGQPVGNRGTAPVTIEGVTRVPRTPPEIAYFAKAKEEPLTAANLAGFPNSHSIPGI